MDTVPIEHVKIVHDTNIELIMLILTTNDIKEK